MTTIMSQMFSFEILYKFTNEENNFTVRASEHGTISLLSVRNLQKIEALTKMTFLSILLKS